ncbi:hypothetical protein PQQ52_18140 [Paraburkholderia sediminicola]|uniref:hypothetical protein n=1 Tax=Paraburkholderia sediminicola TaxID=458836 RepID=UPI0038BCAFE5
MHTSGRRVAATKKARAVRAFVVTPLRGGSNSFQAIGVFRTIHDFEAKVRVLVFLLNRFPQKIQGKPITSLLICLPRHSGPRRIIGDGIDIWHYLIGINACRLDAKDCHSGALTGNNEPLRILGAEKNFATRSQFGALNEWRVGFAFSRHSDVQPSRATVR